MPEIDFKQEFGGMDSDISHIDYRLDKINANLVLLQSNVDRLTQMILNSSGPNQTPNQPNRGQLYSVQADVLRTLALYNDNYQRLLDLKFKYRAEHNDFRIKTVRFSEIEIKRNLQEADISYNSVIMALSKLSDHIVTNNSPTSKFDLNFDKDEEI
jgi:hypothetical protein